LTRRSQETAQQGQLRRVGDKRCPGRHHGTIVTHQATGMDLLTTAPAIQIGFLPIPVRMQINSVEATQASRFTGSLCDFGFRVAPKPQFLLAHERPRLYRFASGRLMAIEVLAFASSFSLMDRIHVLQRRAHAQEVTRRR